jgi:DNA-directed RNA polymerase specialized sigma24 family protein
VTARQGGRRYANAADVLPRDLFREVQRHFVGTLYVGSEGLFHSEREQLVLALKEKKVPVREIAAMAGITTRRVHQIVRAAKERAGRK